MTTTERLDLVPADDTQLAAFRKSDAELARRLDVGTAAGWFVFPAARATISQGAGHVDGSPHWGTYWFIHRADRMLIGFGGFKGSPTDGVVEVGYALAPQYRGRGLGREALEGLSQLAFANGADRIQARTMPAASLSTRLLSGAGFVCVEKSETWLWERARG